LDLEVLDDAEQNENIKSKKNFFTSASISRWPHGPSLKKKKQKKMLFYTVSR
jgi:hypothetical protein